MITSPSPIRDRCPSEDVYLADFYNLLEQGKLDNISAVLEEKLSYDLRSDLVVALIHLVGAVPAGTFEGLQAIEHELEAETEAADGLAVVTRWIASTGPHAPYYEQFAVVRRLLTSCPGKPILSLLSDVIGDNELRLGATNLLQSSDLSEILAEFELEDDKGRAAVRALVRNVMASLTSPDFDVNALLDILGLLFDLEAETGVQLQAAVSQFFAEGDNKKAVVELVKCLQASDTELVLVDLLYDLLTDKALSVTQFLPDESLEPSSNTDSLTTVGVVLEALAADTTTRRGLAEVLILLLNEEYVVSVLGDVANVLEADLLDDFIKLAAAYATKSCE
jgi:hypothetical protein